MKSSLRVFGMGMIIFLGISLSASPVTNAARYTDGLSWVECSGRWTIAYRQFGKARMWVYGCSNGYVFTHVSSTTTANKFAFIKRHKPWAQEVRGSSSYGVTTDMVGTPKGSCYWARGYSQDSGAREVSFCL
jgi:hypothetical protein